MDIRVRYFFSLSLIATHQASFDSLLGLDRDSSLVSHLFDERDEAVKRKLERVIACAKQFNRKIGICGQAPSDYPEFAQFLVEQGIDSISLNPDSVLKTRLAIAKTEATILK